MNMQYEWVVEYLKNIKFYKFSNFYSKLSLKIFNPKKLQSKQSLTKFYFKIITKIQILSQKSFKTFTQPKFTFPLNKNKNKNHEPHNKQQKSSFQCHKKVSFLLDFFLLVFSSP